MAKLNERGHEILDSTPTKVPLNFKRPLPVAEMVRRMVQREISASAKKHGAESFEESDDFEVGDDPEIRSKYELDEDQANYKYIPEEPKDEKREGAKSIDDKSTKRSVPSGTNLRRSTDKGSSSNKSDSEGKQKPVRKDNSNDNGEGD